MNVEELLPQVKEIELDILSVVDSFCKKNNIKYSLAYGTLIGAVRHKGFIPWDDDIDIWMTREDYDRFIELWLDNPVDGYVIQNTELDVSFTENFTKIRKNNTAFIQGEIEQTKKYHKGIFIDIFPLDRAAISSLDYKKQVRNAKIYTILVNLFYGHLISVTTSNLRKIAYKFIYCLVPKRKQEKLVKLFKKKYLSLAGDDTCPFISNSTDAEMRAMYPSDMMDSFVTLQFEDREFMAVKKWDEALTLCYGDYMQLPPEEQRISNHNPVLIDLEHNYEDLV